ncbi:spore germination protein [Clostridium sp. CX1]|uniref:GerAB/ArcD/ProY family transporter n=1 Tax=Clostridium sp. CX1 TaxID=2978346 RepID=UPI0021C02A8E|nr:spore germination protein [Clostridium sp. CX1]MCT8975067.1 spore germination protein [Clostridium sp. CX1]
MKGKHNITSKQMALLTFIAQTGMGMITLPTIMARMVGHDGWISILIAGIISVMLGILIVLLLKRYCNRSIYDINRLIFGRLIGFIVNTLLIVYLLLAAAASARIFSVFLRLTLLPRTPVFIIVPFVMLPSIYLVWCGLKYVVRFKYISLMAYVVSIIYLLILTKQYRFSFLLPIGEAEVLKVLSGVKTGFFTFLGLELVAFVFPEINDKKNLLKWHIIAISLTTLFSLIIVVTSTALFGENFLKIQTIPLFNLGRVYNAPILERLDLYLIASWFIVMGCSMRAYMFAAYYSLGKVFKIKDSKGNVLIFFVVLILLSRIPRDINEAFMARQVISLAGIGVYLFLVLCFCLSFVRTKGVESHETY